MTTETREEYEKNGYTVLRGCIDAADGIGL